MGSARGYSGPASLLQLTAFWSGALDGCCVFSIITWELNSKLLGILKIAYLIDYFYTLSMTAKVLLGVKHACKIDIPEWY